MPCISLKDTYCFTRKHIFWYIYNLPSYSSVRPQLYISVRVSACCLDLHLTVERKYGREFKRYVHTTVTCWMSYNEDISLVYTIKVSVITVGIAQVNFKF